MTATTATLPSLPQLPRMESNSGAVATLSQRLERRPVAAPRGFAQPREREAKGTSSSVPATRSALWFKELHAGYRSAQFVHYSTDVVDVGPLLAAEALELKTAATRQGPWDAPGADHTLPPRQLAP